MKNITKNKALVGIIGLTCLGLIGCGKGHSNNPFRALATVKKSPELQGSYESKCKSDHEGVAANIAKLNWEGKYARSSRREVSFKGDAATIKETHYFGANCDGGEAYAYSEKGTFKVGDKDKNEMTNAGRHLDIEMNRVDAVVMSDDGALFANKMKLCGHNDWKVGDRARDVTGQAADSNCFGVTPKRKIANVFQVDQQSLALGYTGDDALDTHPGSLDTNYTFRRK